MTSSSSWWKPLRKILLRLLVWTEKHSNNEGVRRGGGQRLWRREIQLPTYVVAAFGMAAFFVVLLFEIGLSPIKVIGLLLFLAMGLAFMLAYLHSDERELLADSEAMMLFGLLYIGAALLMQLFKQWGIPLATPLAVFPLLTGLLLSRSLALMSAIVLSMILGVLSDFSLEIFFVNLAGSLTGVVAVSHIRTRGDLTRLGFKIAFANTVAILIIHFFHLWPLKTLGVNVGWGILSGVGAALLVIVFLPFFENFFSRTTNIKLIELADFNQPLLKRLMIEAPGTYHHSLITASLAEQAAEAIGDNSLLARVVAYYHDIGKLTNPEYFIENQQPMANPHDPLTPMMSSLVVTSHVKEGVALARQYNIDKVIIDCIEQHHGTSLIHYFYHRALEYNPEIKAENFRYPGPTPQTKVAAILMLSDAVEAASRSIEEPTPSRLKDTVEKVINNKFTDGQFAECPITLHDLSCIVESMVSSLTGIYHARIEYQKTEKQS